MSWKRGGRTGRDDLGQFATPSWVASLIVDQLEVKPNLIYDLGVGLGALSFAARDRFPNAQIIGVDIDFSTAKIKATLKEQSIYPIHGDLTKVATWGGLKERIGQADLIITNPPFMTIPKGKALARQNQQVASHIHQRWFNRSEIIFLIAAQRLRSPNGQIAIILPYSIIELKDSVDLQSWMLSEARLTKIIELPIGAFSSTEVRAGIFIFGGMPTEKVIVYESRGRRRLCRNSQAENYVNGILNNPQLCDSQEKRIDHESGMPTLASLGIEVRRGLRSKIELRDRKVPYFHTTSFALLGCGLLDLGAQARVIKQAQVLAEEGDILLPRVGSRCLSYEARVLRGRREITDCVLRLRGPEDTQRIVWKFIRSKAGKKWRENIAHGACAKFFPQKLLSMTPIPL